MNTFTNTSVQSVLDKVCEWETDKAVSTCYRVLPATKKQPERHTFFASVTAHTRYVVWCVVDGKVQRREYRRNRLTKTTTLFVEYYQCSPVVVEEEQELPDSYFDRIAERAAWNV